MSRLTDFLDSLTPRVSPVPIQPDGGAFIGTGSSVQGHAQDLFTPNEYGDYLATSNDIYSAAMLRAKSLAKLDLQYHNASREILDDGGDVERLLQFVNPFWTRRRLLLMYELSMTIWGQCYFAVAKTASGRPQELWWIKPTRIRPVIHPTEYIRGYKYTPPGGGSPMMLLPDEVLWFRYPNVIDEFSGLAPLAAARLAADSASSAMHANQKLFDQGLMLGGAFIPPDESELSKEQADQLEEQLDRRFRGADKAHRWAVFRYAFRMENMSVSPKDADFINGMNLSFRQVCRALGVPSQLLNDGEFATLANMTVYERQLWEQTMQFEAAFMADELNEQLLPMFRNSPVTEVTFDLSNIAALQEDRTEKEQREMQQIADGRITINEWRVANGYEEVPWGDAYWASWNMVPVLDSEIADGGKEPVAATNDSTEGQPRALQRGYFSERDPYTTDENRLARTLGRLMERQLDAVISTVNARTVDDAASNPFDLDRWIRTYAEETEPSLIATMTKAERIGNELVGNPLDIDDLASATAIRGNEFTLEMARRTNTTLFEEIQGAVATALDSGADVDGVTGAIRKVLGPDAIEWRARRVAATEVTKATSWGQMEVWRVAGVKRKRWVTQGDDLVRDSHAAINGQIVDIDGAFSVGGCIADAPGLSGCGEEDINCRCRVEPVGRRSSDVTSRLSEIARALGVPE